MKKLKCPLCIYYKCVLRPRLENRHNLLIGHTGLTPDRKKPSNEEYFWRNWDQPDLVDRPRHGQQLRILPYQTFPGLDAQVQFLVPVSAIDALVILETFSPE